MKTLEEMVLDNIIDYDKIILSKGYSNESQAMLNSAYEELDNLLRTDPIGFDKIIEILQPEMISSQMMIIFLMLGGMSIREIPSWTLFLSRLNYSEFVKNDIVLNKIVNQLINQK